MIAKINKNGDLLVKAENELESYALKCWCDNKFDLPETLFISLDIDDTGAICPDCKKD